LVSSKKTIYQPVSEAQKPKSFMTSNVKVNSSTNIVKNGVTKYLQLDPLLKSKMSKNFDKGGKFSSIVPKLGSEMSIKKTS
jgi:hypothetical protein